jgi:hypothetical protein
MLVASCQPRAPGESRLKYISGVGWASTYAETKRLLKETQASGDKYLQGGQIGPGVRGWRPIMS